MVGLPYVAGDSVLERRLAADLVRARGEFVLAEAYAARRAPLGLPLLEVAAELSGATHRPALGADSGEDAFAAALDADLRVLEAVERAKAALDAIGLEALARMDATASAELGARHAQSWVDRTPLSAREVVVSEVATATGLSVPDVGRRVELATAPAARSGFLRGELAAGRTTLARATRLVAETTSLSDEAADSVARRVLAPTRDGAGLSPSVFSQRLRRGLVSVPAGEVDEAARRRQARSRVGAFATVGDDGFATLTVIDAAHKVVAALETADTRARAVKAAGDLRSLDEIRADLLLDPAGLGVAAAVWLVVPAATALGIGEDPAELPGHGYLSASQARAVMTAPGSVWHALLADLDTGKALALYRKGYRPTAEMIAHVRAVDGVCRAPGCTVLAGRCDLDHVEAFDHDDPDAATTTGNLSATHRRHHRLKTAGVWDAERDPDSPDGGLVRWRTAAGRTYTTHPKDWFEHLRDPQPRSPAAADTPSGSPPRHPRTSETWEPPPF